MHSVSIRSVAALAVVFVSLAASSRVRAAPGDDRAITPQFAPAGIQFIARFCGDCHGDSDPEADLSLTAFKDTQSLILQRKKWDALLRMVNSGVMPPADSAQPTAEEKTAFLKLVASIFEHHDRTAPPDPGRVTIRRLNRREYNNTIRDLVGVDFNPAEDFPSDDVGHGFDNIGDVLTLPPVLMERYLAAAESIMSRAITPYPPKPTRRNISCRYCEPAGRDVPKSRFRPITTSPDAEPIHSGPLFRHYKVDEGEFVFRARVFAEAPEGVPVRAVVLACSDQLTDRSASDDVAGTIAGKAVNGLRPFFVVATIDVEARAEDKAQQIEVTVPWTKGLDRMAIGMLKPDGDDVELKLHIESLSLEGPLDTRPAAHRRLLTADESLTEEQQTRQILDRFASRAYRRPATKEEIDRLIELAQVVTADGGNREEGIQFAMQAVLCSPKFLFRAELDDTPENETSRPLNDYQLASRLSYFLWSSMPDDELLELAAAGTLRSHLGEQVQRMLKNPRAKELVDSFALQWLQLQRIETFAPDAELFPSFNEYLRRSMLGETRRFLLEIVQEDRSLLDMLTADYTYLNEPLARHYGIADSSGSGPRFKADGPKGTPIRGRDFVRVTLANGERGGLLTQASVLTVTSNPTRTSPVKRGKWVLEQLLGTPPPPPPPNVPELEAEGRKLTGTLREQMKQHRENSACAACHTDMDTLGFAFENFDPIGRWRDRDGEHDIDPSGELPGGKSFAGPAELKQLLLDRKDDFTRCITEKMLTYALGRGLEYYDRPTINRIVKTVGENDYRFSSLVSEIVESEPFVNRRGVK
ncbi:MAG: DUF1592 domain-containing protein [Planctomycetota bacterium]|jgi:hypothetical protein